MKKIWLIKIITFLSAFLLFQIEFIIGKILLPNFGGSYLVWGACVVFFQAALLLGYLYAHTVLRSVGIKRYRYIHVIVLFLPLLFFPGRPLPMDYAPAPGLLVLVTFKHLLATVGLVFFVLSTMSLIWQVWLQRSDLPERHNPYILFGVSNLGSFLALLSYPFLVELFLDLNVQQNIWRIAYGILVFLQITALYFIPVVKEPKSEATLSVNEHLTWDRWMRWLLLSAAAVVLFLSVTHMMTAEIAPIPLLWMLPLAVYLLSFVLNFKQNPWCPGWIKNNIHIFLGLGAVYYFFVERRTFPVIFNIGMLLFFVFVVCMFCQAKLYEDKPKDEKSLTLFYVLMSLGGFVGGLLATWVAPLVTTMFLEYLWAFLLVSLVSQPFKGYQVLGLFNVRLIIYFIAFLCLWPNVFQDFHPASLLFLIAVVVAIFSQWKRHAHALGLALFILIFAAPFLESSWTQVTYLYKHRNYYGINKIIETNKVRYFAHGATIHGVQYKESKAQKNALAYFAPESPIGEVMSSDIFSFERIGVLGLGIGTLSTYLRPGKELDYFELDPDVMTVANQYFYFLKNASGKINYILGDGRISLKNASQFKRYQLFVVDAFSGDAVPAHLLTKEAMMLYRQHLSDDGIVMLHITNRYVVYDSVVAKTALEAGAYPCIKNSSTASVVTFPSKWMAVTWDKGQVKKLTEQLNWKEIHPSEVSSVRPWTDQYSSILTFFKSQGLLD